MALVVSFTEVSSERDALHDAVECGWRSFRIGHTTVLQLDTYGRPGRKMEGKVSQTIQLDEAAAGELLRLIRVTFPELQDG